jgi:protein LSM14
MMFRGSLRGGVQQQRPVGGSSGPSGGAGPTGGRPTGDSFGSNRQVRSAGPQLKFEGEFDFETANAQFDKEQIEKELKEKLTIGDKSDKELKSPSSHGAEHDGGGPPSADEEEEEDTTMYYDKTKSFFDNISCEASERAKGSNNRPNWREERKLNAETFGLRSASQYNRRGGYRGNRGRGGGGRGDGSRGYGGPRGGRGNYRGGQGGGRLWNDYEYNYQAAGLTRNARSGGVREMTT